MDDNGSQKICKNDFQHKEDHYAARSDRDEARGARIARAVIELVPHHPMQDKR